MAVRVGNFVSVGVTAPIGADGKTTAPGDAAGQTRRCFEIIKTALEKAGAGLKDVVRTRIMLKRVHDWEAAASVHGGISNISGPPAPSCKWQASSNRSGWSKLRLMRLLAMKRTNNEQSVGTV